MAIRLNKVLTELNIGLQTAVDFLKNNKSLGEIKDDANLSTKISDEQYDALKSHFKGEKDMKNEAEKIFAKKAKDKKPEKNVVKTEGELEKRQQFTPLGKIDLSSIGKKPAQSAPVKEEPKAAAVSPVVEKKEEKPVQPKPEAPKAEAPKVEVPKVETPKAEAPKAEPVKVEPKPVEKKVEAPKEAPRVEVAPKAEPVAETADEPKIYTLKSENKLAPKVNVLGKIDLDSLNQSTRPKKKSKEERKKEREEKAAQMHGGERKKRVRIGKERVDIEAAANQQGGNGNNKKNKNKGGNNNNNNNQNNGGQRQDNQQGGGKNKKKNRQQPKPLEVNEEDVARQVKETLARLTAKNQNQKGAK